MKIEARTTVDRPFGPNAGDEASFLHLLTVKEVLFRTVAGLLGNQTPQNQTV
jgi:hypothetical protein